MILPSETQDLVMSSALSSTRKRGISPKKKDRIMAKMISVLLGFIDYILNTTTLHSYLPVNCSVILCPGQFTHRQNIVWHKSPVEDHLVRAINDTLEIGPMSKDLDQFSVYEKGQTSSRSSAAFLYLTCNSNNYITSYPLQLKRKFALAMRPLSTLINLSAFNEHWCCVKTWQL